MYFKRNYSILNIRIFADFTDNYLQNETIVLYYG